jgi:RHS repeat-associated protein
MELDIPQNGTTATATLKTYWPMGLGVEIDPPNSATSQLRWTHSDRLGSIVAITNETGALAESMAFDAWGSRRNANGDPTVIAPTASGQLDGQAEIDNKGFTGQEMLDKLALVHLNGRIYDPLTSRFLSADPLIQDPTHSQSYNRYTYVWNNPTNMTDPTGFAGVCIAGNCMSSSSSLAARRKHHGIFDELEELVGETEQIGAFMDYVGQSLVPKLGWTLDANATAKASAKDGGGTNTVGDPKTLSSLDNIPPPQSPGLAITATNPGHANSEFNTRYQSTILGQNVSVDITASQVQQVQALSSHVNSAIDTINTHSAQLSRPEIDSIHNIRGITVHDNARTSIDQASGIYNIRSSYIMASSSVWLASTIAHDSYHVTQFRRHDLYNPSTAARLEREANRFQIEVGRKFGLSRTEIEYIKNDTHTLYNTSGY